jgi:hypothetical protein
MCDRYTLQIYLYVARNTTLPFSNLVTLHSMITFPGQSRLSGKNWSLCVGSKCSATEGQLIYLAFPGIQGNVDKVVVVIKDKEQVALERFIFSIQSMVQVQPFEKDSRFSLRPLACHWCRLIPPPKYSGCHVRRLSWPILSIFPDQTSHD